MKRNSLLLTLSLLSVALTGCTGQIPGSIRLGQQEEVFNTNLSVNTKVDLLWVVDDSASMDVAQSKLRAGFSAFATKYMQPTWDIRSAVITTDAYLANAKFSPYLNTVIPGTVGWASPYINSRLASWTNPTWNPTLLNKTNGKFDAGVKYKELVLPWGPDFAKLLPGQHDGPVAALCSEALPYSLNGTPHCGIRDAAGANTGVAHCLNPNTGAGETSLTQCVNTVQNNTIRTGRAIINTMPSSPLTGAALTAWTQQLKDDFEINLTTGTSGSGSERGLSSLLQMLNDNEPTGSPTKFFRPGSVRAIIFVSDEDDQSTEIPASPAAGFNPFTYYKCDQAGLIALNGAAAVTGMYGYCCTDPTKQCSMGDEGTTCAPKTVDGFTYTPSVCPREDKLIPVASVKSQLDSFFQGLDGASAESNYFVVTITPMTGASIQQMQADRTTEDMAATGFKMTSTDRADRYIELGNLVGNGSMAMNMAANDYSPLLESIGQAIVNRIASYTLARAPTSQEEMIVTITHGDSTSTVVPATSYTISGKVITLNSTVVLGLAATDKISINYQPKTAF